MKNHLSLRALVEGAILVALAVILSLIKLWEMPWGGEIILSMVPLIFYSVRRGLTRGLLACFVFGVLQFVMNGGFAIGWASILGDYVIAFTVVGLAGIFYRRERSVFYGTLVGCGARFLVHYVVGATIWAEYMPEEFFNMSMTTPWFYSLLYNLSYMLPTTILTLLVFALLYKPLRRYILAEDLK